MKNVKSQSARNGYTEKAGVLTATDANKVKAIKLSAKALKAHLQKAFAILIERTEQVMFDSTSAAGMENIAFDLQVFQKSSKYLPSLYIDNVVKNVTSSLQPISRVSGKKSTAKEDPSWSTLQLLETDEMDTQLLIDGYISKNENRLSNVLYSLQRRVEFISNAKELKVANNPFAPSVLMRTYVDLIKGESFSKEASKILFKTFDSVVLENIGDVLEEINELFIKTDILPTLKKEGIKKADSDKAHGTKGNSASGGVAQGASNQPQGTATPGQKGQSNDGVSSGIEPALYSSLVEMAEMYRVQSGEELVTGGLRVSGTQLPTGELISTLTTIQKKSSLAGVDVKESVRSQIGESLQVEGNRPPYVEQDEILIDVIAMFFDLILQDKHLPDAVRSIIAQLQIPILKVVMIDKKFFAKKGHPARHFLNSLSRAGLGVSEKSLQIRNAVFEKMEELVNRVLMEFDDDIEIFVELVEEFDIFMEQQQRQINLLEDRSRKESKSAEQLELTKRQAAYEIALRLQGKSIPEFVRLFLDDAWKDVLVLALLRRDREPNETHQCLSVLERLVTSATKPNDEQASTEIHEGWDILKKDIRDGLENISYDFHESTPFINELEAWHELILTAETDEQVQHASEESNIILVNFDKKICAASLEEDLLQELEGAMSTMPKDKYSKQANNIKIGDWVQYKNSDGLLLRAKFSWKSSVTLKCLFVNDRGAKAMDISIADLAEELRQHRVSLVGQEKAPLVERVLLGMKKLMKSKEAEPCMS